MNPFDGIKVLDFTRALAGPYCTQLLAQMGADVIKIETMDGDDARYLGPPFLKGESALFLCSNHNKKGIALDYSHVEGKKIIYNMIKNADVIVENFRPGVMSKYGLDYKYVKTINPQITYCSITAWGSEGPYRDKPGVDSILQAMSGLSMISGEEGGPPTRIGTPMIDIATGVYAALGVAGALIMREKTGIGQHIELSLLNVSLMLQLPKIQEYFITNKNPARTGLYSSFGVIGGFFKTKTGYISLSIINDKYWKILCESIGMPSFTNDKRFNCHRNRMKNKDEIYEILNNVLSKKSNKEWKIIFDKNKLLSGIIYSYKNLFNDKDMHIKNILSKASHKKCGNIPVLKFPITMDKCKGVKIIGSPVLGEHTKEILKKMGYDAKHIRMLAKNNIIK